MMGEFGSIKVADFSGGWNEEILVLSSLINKNKQKTLTHTHTKQQQKNPSPRTKQQQTPNQPHLTPTKNNIVFSVVPLIISLVVMHCKYAGRTTK